MQSTLKGTKEKKNRCMNASVQLNSQICLAALLHEGSDPDVSASVRQLLIRATQIL